MKYDHVAIEEKWQKYWASEELFKAGESPPRRQAGTKKKKFYGLIEFPYPSGEGLHVGHIRSNTAMDIIARKRRMEGYDVLFPIGWDSFGLPTENYAIKMGVSPRVITKQNTDTFKKQLISLGFSFDWSREVDTSDPDYYKWTQWIFIQFFKHGLAYKKRMPINWCVSCKIGLANEEVIDGKCERCGSDTEKREKEQWMLAITKYAGRLIKDLDGVDYPERIKIQQKNWIGRSEGAIIKFQILGGKYKIPVFTTRPDTIDGAVFLVLAPEHPFAKMVDKGTRAVNPYNGREIPVFVDEYVLMDYGTGAIMGVPRHDERDREFAERHKLPIIDKPLVPEEKVLKKTGGNKTVSYKLRDWVFSRQHYWGEPTPMIRCARCGWVPVREEDLPVKLPNVEKYEPTNTGESPLAKLDDWVNTKCPKCEGPAKRETDTMPNWAGSSWYYWSYLIALNLKSKETITKQISSTKFKRQLKRWLPVDWYNGGMEHTTLHLLYSRFWHKFLYDIKVVPSKEPYLKRTSHGMILAEGGVKMSKSKGNVINPDDIVKAYGADTLRIYEMFMGPFDQAISWNTDSLIGAKRFLDRVLRLKSKVQSASRRTKSRTNPRIEILMHKTIKKVTNDIEAMKFNTAISALMVLVNVFEKEKSISKKNLEQFILLFSPFAPHVAEELWSRLGRKKSVLFEKWPKYDARKATDDFVTLVVQVNGKVRDTVRARAQITELEAKSLALSSEKARAFIRDREIKRVIFVPQRLINLVS